MDYNPGGASPDHIGDGTLHLVCECGYADDYSPDDADSGFFSCRQCSALHPIQATAADPHDFHAMGSISVRRVATQPTMTPKLRTPAPNMTHHTPYLTPHMPYMTPHAAAAAPAFDDFDEPSEPRDFALGAGSCDDPEDLGARIRWRYVRGLQVILQRQLEVLVERFRVGALICGVSGTIWMRWVAASEVFDEMWARQVLADHEAEERRMRSGGGGDKKSDEVKEELEEEILTRRRDRRRVEFSFLRSLRMKLPIYSTLAVSFLSCHVAREAVLPTDIYKWSMEGKIPYMAAFTEVDKLLGRSMQECPLDARQLFRPVRVIGAWQLETAAGSIAARIGLRLPSVNFYAIALRCLKDLSVPSDRIISHACRIYEWAMPSELWLSANPARIPTREICEEERNTGGTDSGANSDPGGSNNEEEFIIRELLCTIAASYDKINVGHAYRIVEKGSADDSYNSDMWIANFHSLLWFSARILRHQSTAAAWRDVSASSSTPFAADVSDMLPGPPLQPPPPPPLVLVGLSSVPSPSPSGPQSLSIGSSLAIVVIVVIATAIVTVCIVLLRRGCRHHRLSCSSLSPRCSFSQMASLSSAESGVQSCASTAVCASPRGRAGMSSLQMVVEPSARKEAGKVLDSASVSRSAEWPVKEGTELAAASSAVSVVGMSGVLVPSTPPLPEVERLILELLVLPAPETGKSRVCLICNSESPDVPLVLPLCSHVFHRSCILTWLRGTAWPCCPFCHASITIPRPGKTNFCSDKHDVESQMLVPATPGEELAGVVGESRGWLRSSLDRLSGSLMGCSSNRATAVVVPVCSRRTTGSWSPCSSSRLGNDSYFVEEQMGPSISPCEVSEAPGGSGRWLRSSLAALSGSWIGFSRDHSDKMVLPVNSKPVTETMASSDHKSMDSRSRRWDVEAATPKPEKPSVYDNIKWFFRT
ncbi:hypothetical protein PR202_ga04370 [Eleusine coracana subsp. coracana]|uniref:RING-type domain-containing protein n=1 Tax=Eleusine coracana subsp. coracana TaxID=191504 RepID=A0AAV5BPQ6_ELECO|nr:hypothetical protein PR202_ga04370 [Eleusine coracana subsp. coracana]